MLQTVYKHTLEAAGGGGAAGEVAKVRPIRLKLRGAARSTMSTSEQLLHEATLGSLGMGGAYRCEWSACSSSQGDMHVTCTRAQYIHSSFISFLAVRQSTILVLPQNSKCCAYMGMQASGVLLSSIHSLGRSSGLSDSERAQSE